MALDQPSPLGARGDLGPRPRRPGRGAPAASAPSRAAGAQRRRAGPRPCPDFGAFFSLPPAAPPPSRARRARATLPGGHRGPCGAGPGGAPARTSNACFSPKSF